MSLEDLANVGEALGGVAVLISLVYLALQIRQNTRTVQATAFQQVVDSFSDLSLAVGLDRRVSEVFVRANRVGFSELDPVEQEQLRFVLLSYFRRAESAFFQSEQGTLNMESWEGIRESLKHMLDGRAVREFWEGNAGSYNSRFRAFVDSELRGSG